VATRSNERFLASRVRWPAGLPAAADAALRRPDPAGAAAVAAGELDRLLGSLESKKVSGAVVGQLVEGESRLDLVV